MGYKGRFHKYDNSCERISLTEGLIKLNLINLIMYSEPVFYIDIKILLLRLTIELSLPTIIKNLFKNG